MIQDGEGCFTSSRDTELSRFDVNMTWWFSPQLDLCTVPKNQRGEISKTELYVQFDAHYARFNFEMQLGRNSERRTKGFFFIIMALHWESVGRPSLPFLSFSFLLPPFICATQKESQIRRPQSRRSLGWWWRPTCCECGKTEKCLMQQAFVASHANKIVQIGADII